MVLLQVTPGPIEELQPPLVVEKLLSAMHAHSQFMAVSLIIATVEGIVSFFVRVPAEMVEPTKKSIYGGYSSVDVSEVEDEILHPQDSPIVRESYLGLRRPGPLPIKRYPQLIDAASRQVVDPVDGLMSTMQTSQHLGIAMQVHLDLTPLCGAYRSRATAALLKLKSREFQRTEWKTDLYLRLSLLPCWARWTLAAPVLIGLHRSIPVPDNTRHNQNAEGASSSHDRESHLQACVSKLQKHLFDVTIRLTVHASSHDQAIGCLQDITAAFGQFDLPGLNGLRRARRSRQCALNTEELATLWHLPRINATNPDVEHLTYRRLPAPRDLPQVKSDSPMTHIGHTSYREQRRPVGVPLATRRRHVWVIGKSGMGKSTLLENMSLSDIHQGLGVAVISPHADLIQRVLAAIPWERRFDVILVDPSDEGHPIAFNPLASVTVSPRRTADELVSVFKLLFGSGPHASWGPQLEDIAHNVFLTLAYAGNTTLVDVLGMLGPDDAFREQILARVADRFVLEWWQNRFPEYQSKQESPFLSVLNKVGQLLSDPLLRGILGQRENKLNLRRAMDDGKIVLCNLSKGSLGHRAAAFLGSLLVTQFQLSALSREDIPEHKRRPFMLYVDEFQNYATSSFAEIVSEARKFGLCLTVANQFAEGQLSKEMIRSLCGNVGTLISFRLGAHDGQVFAEEMGAGLTRDDFTALPPYECYVHQSPTPPFSLRTIPPPEITVEEELRRLHPAVHPGKLLRRKVFGIRRSSNRVYATPTHEVEASMR